MPKHFVLAAVVAASSCVSEPEAARLPPQAPSGRPCALTEGDRAWIDRALEAWRLACREITGIGGVPRFRAIIFSADCVLTSGDALMGASAEAVTWKSASHAGTIGLPDGSSIPAGVTSFTSGADGLLYFVMSTPSVWEAAGVGQGPDLETTMVAVLLHESSHVAQIGPYGQKLGTLIDRYALPDSFGDNVVQERFQANREFAESVEEETRLFVEAAAAGDDGEAKLLAQEARDRMRERQARWFTGEDVYLLEAEDLWLTFEGAGQWVAYQWMIHPSGEASTPAEVLPRFTHGSQWSQTEGFAVVLALDRIAGADWKRHAFGDGEHTVLEMLDAALVDQ